MAKITDTMVGQIIQAIGGRDNITNCGHCMTRLRLSLADSLYADRDTIKRIAGVMGVIESDNQFQIVLGPGKAQTACEMMNGMLSTDAGTLTAPRPQSTDLGDIAAANKQALKQKQSSAAHRTASWPSLPPFLPRLFPALSLRVCCSAAPH
ncbi:PTS transporter subunit EIIB [Aeromonas veronii]